MKKLIAFLMIVGLISGCGQPKFSPLEDIPSNYTLEDALEDGYVVYEDMNLIQGKEIIDDFVSNETKEMRIVWYFNVPNSKHFDPTYYNEIKDEYPVIYVFDVKNNNDGYTVRHFEDGKEIVEEYQYLINEENGNEYYEHVIFLCNEEVTYPEVIKSGFSSATPVFIKSFPIYQIQKEAN